MITAILAVAVIFLGNLALAAVAYRRYLAEKKTLLTTLRAYFEPPAADQQSQFGILLDTMADRLGKKTANSLKATFLGEQSVDARNAKRLEGDLAADMASQQNPLLGLAMKQFPSFGKRLMNNPALIEAGLKLLGGMGNITGKPERGGDGKQAIESWNKYD